MLQSLYLFLKNPVYKEDENTNLDYRLSLGVRILVLGLGVSILLVLITATIESFFNLELGKHAINELVATKPIWHILLLGVVIAPFFEELIFRGPLALFKNSPYFKQLFYGLAIIFGLIHISNFETTTATLILIPLLVAPQIWIGILFGYIRIRFGLAWAMGLHSTHNLVLFIPLALSDVLNIPLE